MKIRKIGNSFGVIIPKSVIEELATSEGAEIAYEVADGSLLLTPKSTLRRDWAEAAQEVVGIE